MNVTTIFSFMFVTLLNIYTDLSSAFLVNYSSSSLKRSFAIPAVKVWVELAEEGFVDKDENLMTGEVCLRALKAFASNDDPDCDDTSKRLLCAGALVQRPSSNVCDAWMADSFLDEPNLQIRGAIGILDDFFNYHLQTSNGRDLAELISTFVVQSGRLESEYHCASYMAAISRGFKPLKDVSLFDESKKSIYSNYLDYEDEDSFALVFDESKGMDRYCGESHPNSVISSIAGLLRKINQTESVLE